MKPIITIAGFQWVVCFSFSSFSFVNVTISYKSSLIRKKNFCKEKTWRCLKLKILIFYKESTLQNVVNVLKMQVSVLTAQRANSVLHPQSMASRSKGDSPPLPYPWRPQLQCCARCWRSSHASNIRTTQNCWSKSRGGPRSW